MSPKKSTKKKSTKKKAAEPLHAECPLSALLAAADGCFEETFGVFRQTRIEFLKAIRTLLDRQIDHLEGQDDDGGKKQRVTKIEVEE